MARIKDPVSFLAGLALISALVVAGCSGRVASAGSTKAPPSTATSTTAAPSSTGAVTTTTAPGDPVVYDPTALVSSQESCKLTGHVHATWTTDPDGTEHVRNGWFTCTVISNDPRVAGAARYTWNADRWGKGASNGSMVQWGIMRITNSGGAWVSRYEGIYTSETGDVVFMLLTGTGDYAGLSYYKWEYKTFGTTWPTEGLIFPSTTASR